MKKIFLPVLILIIILQPPVVKAQVNNIKQVVTGSWLGNLEAAGTTLRLVYKLKLNDRDSLMATMDSPDQGASNVPLGRVVARNDSLIIHAPLLMGVYKGSIKNDSTINGTWTQRGNRYTLDLKKISGPLKNNRPQEPKAPFPYTSEEVRFPNSKFNIFLAGTLTIPQGKGPFPAVILITGSGPQNRDEALMGHKPFLVIADWLTRNGIAVLRYDDRGVAKSQGVYSMATSADLATDAEAALSFLKTDSRINPGMTGLMGHSEGGLIAPIVASTNPGVAFIVSLAGPGVTGEEIVLKQNADISRISGLTEEKINDANDINRQLYEVIKSESDNQKAEDKVLETYRKILTDKKMATDDIEQAAGNLQRTFGAKTYTWFRYFLATDPATFWKKVKCPVLALNGEKDLQVSADLNLPAISNALKSSGNNNCTTIRLPGLNHLFQHCTTGLPAEYSKIEETFSPEALKIISDWILGLRI